MKHGFASWFEKHDRHACPKIPKAVAGALVEKLDDSECDSDEHSTFAVPQTPQDGRRMSEDKLEAGLPVPSSLATSESVVDVLYYMKSSFEDETLLDSLPLEAASNTGAWSAWAAHRRAMDEEAVSALQVSQSSSQSQSGESGLKRRHPPSNWNWEGVWSKRVVAIIEASASDPALFTNSENDEPVSTQTEELSHSLTITLQLHFLDLDEEAVRSIKSNFS